MYTNCTNHKAISFSFDCESPHNLMCYFMVQSNTDHGLASRYAGTVHARALKDKTLMNSDKPLH